MTAPVGLETIIVESPGVEVVRVTTDRGSNGQRGTQIYAANGHPLSNMTTTDGGVTYFFEGRQAAAEDLYFDLANSRVYRYVTPLGGGNLEWQEARTTSDVYAMGSPSIDFKQSFFQTYNVIANTTFTDTNMFEGGYINLFITNETASTKTLAWPAWKWTTATPTSILAGQTIQVKLFAINSFSSGVYAFETQAAANTAATDATAAKIAAQAAAAQAASDLVAVEAAANNVLPSGSVLQRIAPIVPAGEQLLKQAVWWIDASHSGAGLQTVPNLGWGGSALDAQAGSGTGVDAGDPKWLDWDGTNYVYLPGVAGNYLSVPDEAALDITGDIDIRVRVALDDWTPASGYMPLVSKWGTAGSRSYLFDGGGDGSLRIVWTQDGSTTKWEKSTVPVGYANGGVAWVRAVLDVNNGAGTPQYEVKFYTSADGSSWTQLGATVTGSTGATSIHSGATALQVGAETATGLYHAGKFYRAQVLNGINGTPVLDIDTSLISTGSATSFPARTGQTVTVNRATSGRKTCLVTHPCWLFGTDRFFQIADNDLLDFGASDSFTVLAVVRRWNTVAGSVVITKKVTASSTGVGWLLLADSTAAVYGYISDGTTQQYDSATYTTGTLNVLSMTRSVADDKLAVAQNGGATTPSTDTTTGTLANSEVMRVGRYSGTTNAYYADMEGFAFAVFRKALTTDEIQTVTNYFTGRVA